MILSLSMIVRNEQDGIAHVLQQAAQFCDELIVLDTGSTDDTVSIAEKAGATVHSIEWPDSFAKARNASRELTKGDWVIHLDGHDHLPQQSVNGFIQLREELSTFPDHVDAVITPMCIVDKNMTPLMSYPRERVTRRHLEWVGDAHTIIAPKSPVYRDYPVYTAQRQSNKPKRALGVLQKQYDDGDHSRRTVFYLAREKFWSKRYVEAIPLYNEWLAMLPVKWEKYSGLLDLAACYEIIGERDRANETRWKAIDAIPTRAEAWAALALDARKNNNNERAIAYLTVCINATKPFDGFVVEQWYNKDYIQKLINDWQ